MYTDRRWPSGRASDFGARGPGFDPHSGRRVVSLSKIHLPPKSTGNNQEAMAPSRHDCKIVYCDVKQKKKNTKAMLQKAVSKSYWKFETRL